MDNSQKEAEIHQTIKSIDEKSIRQIVAGQAIFDLSSAVKELVENSLDAGAKNITIRLYKNGIEKIQVEDDGIGVPVASRYLMAMKHATSKISKFEDLNGSPTEPSSQIRTPNLSQQQLGFRGEALFCLANLSEKLEITTKTANDRVGQKLRFHQDGLLDNDSVCNIPRKVGTTVTVHKLFAALPVRKLDFTKRIKSQRAKMLKLLQGYAIMCLGVKFTLIDVKGKVGSNSFKTEIKLATSINSRNLEDTVSSVLGSKFLSGLCDIKVDLSDIIHQHYAEVMDMELQNSKDLKPENTATNYNEPPNGPIETENKELPSHHSPFTWKLEGLVSKSPSFSNEISLNKSQSKGLARELQFFSINNRLVDLPKLSRVLSDAWREFDSSNSKRPACIIAITLPKYMIDVNLSPDKREVLLEHEDAIIETLYNALTEVWNYQSKGTFMSNEVETQSNIMSNEKKQIDLNRFTSPFGNKPSLKQRKFDIFSKVVTPGSDIKEKSDKDKVTTTNLDSHTCSSTEEKSQSESIIESLAKLEKNSTNFRSNANASPPLSPSSNIGDIEKTDKEKRKWTETQYRFNSLGQCKSPQAEEIEFVKAATPNYSSQNKENSRSQVNRPKRQLLKNRESPKSTIDSEGVWVTSHNNEESPKKRIKKPNTFAPKETKKSSVIWGDFSLTKDVIRDACSARKNAKKYSQHLQHLKSERNQKQEQNLSSGKKYAEESDFVQTDSSSQISPSESTTSQASKSIRLNKDDFLDMQVIGQFNLGFILARCQNHHLWMFDQHACDEKYNFERICETTIIHEQKLIAPLPLELSPSEENCIMDHMDLFNMNGFKFVCDETKPVRQRLSLTALPHSGSGGDGKKAVQFGKDDVAALCAILGADGSSSATGFASGFGTGADGGGAYTNHAVRRYASAFGSQNEHSLSQASKERKGMSVVRLPKAIAMFASRACRGSIMIGTALSDSEMGSVIRKLHKVNQPWDCPHGRPTMRHVKDILDTVLNSEIKGTENTIKYENLIDSI